MQMIVDDTLVHYTQEGQANGPVLLGVHGWMHDHTSFAQLTAQLKSKYRIISVDLPNFGASQHTTDIVSLTHYANFLATLLDKLEVHEYVYMGHSMGGQLGIFAVGEGILRPKKLILLASAGVRNKRPLKRKVLQAMAKPGKYLVPEKYKLRFYKFIESDYSPKLSDEHKKVIDEVLKTDVQASAAKITIPTLLVFGGQDRFTTPDMGQVLHQLIKGSRLEIIPDEKHWLHQQSAPQVAGFIKEFLQ